MVDGRTTDRQRWSLRGPVRTCTIHRTWGGCSGGACGTDTRHDTAYVEFRPDGALTLHRHENHDGSSWLMTREYDESGRLVAQRSGDDSPADGTFYEYDAEGRLEQVIARRAGTPERVAETYEYGADGTMKKTEHVECPASGCSAGWTVEGSGTGYMADGAATIVVRYDQRGQPVETTFTDSEGRPLTRVTLSYDEDGRLVEEGSTLIDIVLPEAIRAQATAADLEQFRAMLGGGRLQSRQMHRYDAQGRRIETRSAMFGDLGEDRRTFAYNERGDQIEEVNESSHQEGSIDQNGLVIPNPAVTKSRSEARFRYAYDSHGNWVEKVVESRADGRDFSVSSTEARQLEYWPRMASD